MKLLAEISNSFGVSEAAIKLMITLYAGYISALIHRSLLFKARASINLIYLSFTGFMMMYWNFGFNVIHSLICVIMQYLNFIILGTSTFSTALSFVFQMVYLLYGYWYYATIDYQIKWLLPHCVLTLRMIGLAFDLYDGNKQKKFLSKDQKETFIKDVPSLLEMLGLSYMYCGFLVGPQFSFRRFRALLNRELTDSPGNKPNSLIPGLRCLIYGTLVILTHVFLSSKFSANYYMTSEFQNSSFLYKYAYIHGTYMCHLLRYNAVWIINDGSCVICGLGFRKDEQSGKVHWDAVTNAHLFRFLNLRSLSDLPSTFNVTTNKWVQIYIYKRLKFVGVREVSQLCALSFLAVWHGWYEGYYTLFFLEFLAMTSRQMIADDLKHWNVMKKINGSPYLSWLPHTISVLVIHSLVAYGSVDFLLKKWNRFYPVHVSLYFYGYVFVFAGYGFVIGKTLLLSIKKLGRKT